MKQKHILIFRLSALGDVAMTIPAVYSVALAYPQHHFHVLTSAFCAQLFINPPTNITIHSLEKNVGTIGLLRYLSVLPIDSVADLHNVLRSWVVDSMFLLKGKHVAMLDKRRIERRDILHHRQATSRPFSKRYFDVFANLGFPCKPAFTSVFTLQPLLPLEIKKGTKHWIGVAPYARYANKTYPLEQMKQVVVVLATRPYTQIFLFGSKGAQAKELKLWELLSPAIVSVAGRFTLEEELSLMAHLDVMISMDSANMHLASLVGIRVVSIWGSTSPACGFLGWRQHQKDAIYQNLQCQPCTIGGSNRCKKHDLECLRSLPPNSIINQCNIT